MNEPISYEQQIDVLKKLVKLTIRRSISGLIVTGASGIGKAYNVEKTLSDNGYHRDDGKLHRFSDFVSPFSFYQILFKHKARDNIILFDNTDFVFSDDHAASILKMALKVESRKRTVQWNERGVFDVYNLSDEEQEKRIAEGKYPNRFDFHGGIIIITNQPKDTINKHCDITAHGFVIEIKLNNV